MNQEQLVHIHTQHNIWLDTSHELGHRADFTNQDVSGLNFTNMNLPKCIMDNTRAHNTNFTNVVFSYSNLSWSSMRESIFDHTNLEKTILINSSLRLAKVVAVNLWGTIGDGMFIKSMNCDGAYIAYTHEVLQINCTQYPLDHWWNTDPIEIVTSIGGHSESYKTNALQWWAKWRPLLKNMIKQNPAKPFLRIPFKPNVSMRDG